MKEFISPLIGWLVAGVVIASIFGFARAGDCAGIHLSETWTMTDTVNYAQDTKTNQTIVSGGLSYGTIWEVRNKAGRRAIGFFGMSGSLLGGDNVDGVLAITPITFFDDTLSFSIGGQFKSFRINDPDSYLYMIGISPLKLGTKIAQ